MNVTKLAKMATVGRCHLEQVLANVPGRGLYTRRRLFPYLTAEEVRLLGWGEEYDRWRTEQGSTGNNVPIETSLEPVL